jgi:DNA polymerase-3 subunit gamma/tau
MTYLPFSLRYRPQSFEEIIGQEHVSRTLQNAVAGGRVVHAYLFAGPRGTGKTSTARVLAKALLCEQGPTPQPCQTCRLCRAIAEGRALDLIEIDAASNRGIEQIRELREKVRYSPAEARYKIYILDEVHMLTPEAFNALLKTLEEPPPHTFFILATTELHKVPPTIVSRCQLFEFHLIAEPRIVEALRAIAAREGVDAEPGALAEIARAARGALRDAESIFDQAVAYADGPVTVEVVRSVLGATPRQAVADLVRAMAAGDLGGMFRQLDALVAAGKDLPQLLQEIMLATRDMLRASLGAGSGEEWQELEEVGRELGLERLAAGLRLLGEAERRLREAVQQQITLELALAEVTQLWSEPRGRQAAREAAVAAGARLGGARAGTQRPAPPPGPARLEHSRPETAASGSAPAAGHAPQAPAHAPSTEAPREAPAQTAAAPTPPVQTPGSATLGPAPAEPPGALSEVPSPTAPPAAAAELPAAPPQAQAPPAFSPEPEPAPQGEQQRQAPASAAAAPRPAIPATSAARPAGDQLSACWKELQLQLKRMRSVSVWAILHHGSLLEIRDEEVLVGFPAGYKWHYDLIRNKYRATVEEAFSAVLKRPVRVRCVLGEQPGEREGLGGVAEGAAAAGAARGGVSSDEEEETGQAAAPPPQQPPPQTDAVQRALELTLDIFPDSEEIAP